jgi:hypothetical protein
MRSAVARIRRRTVKPEGAFNFLNKDRKTAVLEFFARYCRFFRENEIFLYFFRIFLKKAIDKEENLSYNLNEPNGSQRNSAEKGGQNEV